MKISQNRIQFARLSKRLRRRPYRTDKRLRAEWIGQRTAASYLAGLIGRRVLVRGVGSLQWLTSGTDPTDSERVSVYLAAHPLAMVEYV